MRDIRKPRDPAKHGADACTLLLLRLLVGIIAMVELGGAQELLAREVLRIVVRLLRARADDGDIAVAGAADAARGDLVVREVLIVGGGGLALDVVVPVLVGVAVGVELADFHGTGPSEALLQLLDLGHLVAVLVQVEGLEVADVAVGVAVGGGSADQDTVRLEAMVLGVLCSGAGWVVVLLCGGLLESSLWTA